MIFTFYSLFIKLIQAKENNFIYDHRVDLFSSGVSMFAIIREDALSYSKLRKISERGKFKIGGKSSRKHIKMTVSF